MKYRIISHVLPHEIDCFYWQAKQLKMCNSYLDSSNEITLDVTLNMNLIDWDKSSIPFDFFVDKFKEIEKLSDWTHSNEFDVNVDKSCMGINDKRRTSIRKSTEDFIIYLDSDVIFNTEILANMINASNVVNDKYFIISPQTVNMWDGSWDIITNKKYVELIHSMESYFSIDAYKLSMVNHGDVSFEKINKFKFGGGWFNLISTNILKLCDIPDSLGSYGVDDLYVMICCDIMKSNGYDISQYVLKNSVVTENNKYRELTYKKYLSVIDNQSNYRTKAENNMNIELQNFYKKLTTQK